MRELTKRFKHVLVMILAASLIFGTAICHVAAYAGEPPQSVSSSFYTIDYSENKVTLLFSANPDDYSGVGKEEFLALKDDLMATLKDAIMDDIDLSTNSSVHNNPAMARLIGFPGINLFDPVGPSPSIDISVLTGLIQSEVSSIDILQSFTEGSFSTVLEVYVDRYTKDFGESDKADALDTIKTEIGNALTVAIDALPAEAQDLKDLALEQVETSISNVENGNVGTITLNDIGVIIDTVGNTESIKDVVKDVDLSAEINSAIMTSSSEDVTQFLKDVDIDKLADIVKKVKDDDSIPEIISSSDIEELLETKLDVSSVISIVNEKGIDSIVALVDSTGMDRDTFNGIVENKVSEITIDDIKDLIIAVKVNGNTVYDGNGINAGGVKEILKTLPKPSELAHYTDSQMRREYSIVIETSLSDVEFDLEIGLYGNCDNIRNIASFVSRVVDVRKTGGTYGITVNSGDGIAAFVTDISEFVSDDFAKRIMNDSSMTISELYSQIHETTLSDYVNLFKQIQYKEFLSYVLDADNLNALFGTDAFTDEKIDKAIDIVGKLLKKAQNITYDKIIDLLDEFMDTSSIESSKLEKAVNKLAELFDVLEDGYLSSSELRAKISPSSSTTNEDIQNSLDALLSYENMFNKFQSVITKAYGLLDDSLKSKTVADLFSNGALNVSETINLKNLFNIISVGSEGLGDYIDNIFDLDKNVNVDLTVKLEGFHKVTYIAGGDVEVTGILPTGADVFKFAPVDEISGSEIVKWVDGDNNEITEIPDEDITLYGKTAITVTISDVEASYVYGETVELSAEAIPVSTEYVYSWYKFDDASDEYVVIAGADEDSLTLTNVADSGKYICRVTDGVTTGESNSVTVVINPAALTAVSVVQTGTLTYTENAQDLEVTVEENATAVNGTAVSFTYSLVEAGPYGALPHVANAAGSYTIFYTASAANHSNATGSFTVTVSKKNIDVSGITWDYTAAFEYDGTAKSVSLTNVPATVSATLGGIYTATEPGTYVASATFAPVDSENYTVSGEVADLQWEIISTVPPIIDVNVSTLTWNYRNPFTYDGTVKTVTLNLSGFYNDIVPIYDGNSFTNAGDNYVATIVGFEYDDTKYNLTGTVAPLSWKINKATINVSGITWNYTAPFEYDGTAKNVSLSNVPATVRATLGGTYTATEPGTYTATVTFAPVDQDNYTISGTVAALQWTIKPPVKTIYDKDGIKIETDAVLPAGTIVDVKDVTEDYRNTNFGDVMKGGEKGIIGAAYDVKLLNNGVVVNPDGTFTIRLPIPEDLLDKNIKVIHIADDGTVTDVDNWTREGDHVVLTVTHFSVYAIIEVYSTEISWIIWAILGLAIVILIIILLLLLFKKKHDDDEGNDAAGAETCFIKLVASDDDIKNYYKSIRDEVLGLNLNGKKPSSEIDNDFDILRVGDLELVKFSIKSGALLVNSFGVEIKVDSVSTYGRARKLVAAKMAENGLSKQAHPAAESNKNPDADEEPDSAEENEVEDNPDDTAEE